MWMQTYTSVRASSLLFALEEFDEVSLHRELSFTKNERYNGIDGGEWERSQLLASIADELSSLSGPLGQRDWEVFRGLLKHLAAPIPWAAGFRSELSPTYLQ